MPKPQWLKPDLDLLLKGGLVSPEDQDGLNEVQSAILELAKKVYEYVPDGEDKAKIAGKLQTIYRSSVFAMNSARE